LWSEEGEWRWVEVGEGGIEEDDEVWIGRRVLEAGCLLATLLSDVVELREEVNDRTGCGR